MQSNRGIRSGRFPSVSAVATRSSVVNAASNPSSSTSRTVSSGYVPGVPYG